MLFLLAFTYGVMFPCVLCFFEQITYFFSMLLVEIIEAWVADEFLQKGFVSDRLLGALLNRVSLSDSLSLGFCG